MTDHYVPRLNRHEFFAAIAMHGLLINKVSSDIETVCHNAMNIADELERHFEDPLPESQDQTDLSDAD